MKEITFLKQNHQKWQQFEALLNSTQGGNPDALADLFIRVTDDLSWARTFYPGSNTEKYLNDMAARIHQEIYKNKKERRSRILTFWTHELPLTMAKHRMNLLIVFAIFFVSVWVGIVSAKHDEGFVRLILGDSYVDMTLDNISKGDPMGVYKQDNHFVMFFAIALNNSMVAMLCILAGLAGWAGVAMMQFRNGVMLGAFMYFLAAHGYMREATLTVWIHGVIEIFCIVVAGAAGMAMGNGLYFPGAWPRGVSFMRGAREALKIGVGLIPFFFLAAFFEGFITRYTEMNDVVREFIIITALILMVSYFIFWPMFVRPDVTKLSRVVADDDTSVIKRELNAKFIFKLVIGILLIVLPTLAFSMHEITGDKTETVAKFFYVLCGCGGIALIVFAFLNRRQTEESQLEIDRKKTKSVKEEYEREATATKV
ncbi:MAG: stage II sporulation protein M [Bacteroidetes bacterium]|nr:stage II sporulation protein M [Bacteroidota bacterium]